MVVTSLSFTWKIYCASGVLAVGSSPDFLMCISNARKSKQERTNSLPYSTLPVQFFYPNNKRVPSEHIKAALRALADPAVSPAVVCRRAAAAQISPARSGARTAEICVAVGNKVHQNILISEE